jgi:hypothetical protein
MGVHINFLGEMKDEVANTSRPNRSSKIWFFRGPFDDYTTDILLLLFSLLVPRLAGRSSSAIESV